MNEKNKAKVRTASLTINLKPVLEDFLRHEMGCPSGPVLISRASNAGKFIYSHITTCLAPPKKNDFANPVELCIPITAANRHLVGYRFLFISKWGEEKIQDYLDAEFNLRLQLMFETGYRKGFRQKDIIEAILQSYNIRHTAVSFDMVKKADYRNRRRIRKIIFDELQNIDS